MSRIFGPVRQNDISGGPGPFFEQIREAARTWDGADPIRRPG